MNRWYLILNHVQLSVSRGSSQRLYITLLYHWYHNYPNKLEGTLTTEQKMLFLTIQKGILL